MKEISDFSTSVCWWNVKLIHIQILNFSSSVMYRNLKFLHGHRPCVRDKYQVCWWPDLQSVQEVPPGAQVPGIQNYNQCLWHHLANNGWGIIWWKNFQAGGHICKQFKWCHMMVKFRTDTSGATKWPNFKHCQRHNGPRILTPHL